jgi:hypothetical protein
MRTGRRVYWDAETSKFINDEDANKFLVPQYRAPWVLPSI